LLRFTASPKTLLIRINSLFTRSRLFATSQPAPCRFSRRLGGRKRIWAANSQRKRSRSSAQRGRPVGAAATSWLVGKLNCEYAATRKLQRWRNHFLD
jgi:hypothetical protein